MICLRSGSSNFTYGYLRAAKKRRRSAITNRYISKAAELFFITPSTTYWENVMLPVWVFQLNYSAKTTWVKLLGKLGGLPSSHLKRSRLKKKQSENQRSWKRLIGGCAIGTWADPQQAPPILPPYKYNAI